ncbi:TonB-dependent receptor plug domain-containing protein [Ancylomarina sp. DW003]|nr:TonB-dependent receptor plug domain-containing protein [Ancylomarina sp. DW003]MDE5422503.1 TonB-dependent receptor plug domain-containing protein [Ancylomarina sp. DW003]
MKKNKLVLLLFFLTFSSLTLLAQKIEVKGKVVVFNTLPVVNANVKVPGSEVVVKTSLDGSFTCMCKEKDKLVITAAGFDKLIIKVKKKKAKKLLAKMRLLKSSEASKMAIEKGHILKVDQFEKLVRERSGIKDYSVYSSVMDILRNEFSALRIVNGEVIIRGKSSLNGSSAARFEVDGVMTEQSMIESLSTSDVASIKVVKGSDAAIYGVRGGTGVIQIKTKKGNSE